MKLLVIIIITILTALSINTAYCFDCTPMRCDFDIDCDLGCQCIKRGFNLEGNCA